MTVSGTYDVPKGCSDSAAAGLLLGRMGEVSILPESRRRLAEAKGRADTKALQEAIDILTRVRRNDD